jgi:hypothetical protein
VTAAIVIYDRHSYAVEKRAALETWGRRANALESSGLRQPWPRLDTGAPKANTRRTLVAA